MRSASRRGPAVTQASRHPRPQDLSTWSGVLDMPGLPQLWSWSGKVQNGSDRWVPVSCAYPPRHLPSDMPLAAAQWLCPPAHLPEAVARAFGTASGAPVVPHRVRSLQAPGQCVVVNCARISAPSTS